MNKTAEKEAKKEEKEKSGKLATLTKKPATKPPTGSSTLGKDPTTAEKKTKVCDTGNVSFVILQ